MNGRRPSRHPLRFAPAARRLAATVVLCVCAFVAPALAQTLPPDAAGALAEAQRIASAALIEYTSHAPDRPLWAEALRLGHEAAAAAPTHPAPQRFLAQAYEQVGFYARAWQAWVAYRANRGTMDAVAVRHVIEVARWMGVSAYDGGRRSEAIPFFEAVLEFAPFDTTANERLARTYLEQGTPLGARPYLEALDGAIPDLADALPRVRRLDLYGEDATLAFEAGRAAAAAGDPSTALARYTEATRLAPEFVEAWRAVADTALWLDQDTVAAEALERLLTLAPDDPAGLAARTALAQAAADRIAAEEAEAAQAEAAARAAEEAAARAAAEAEAARLAAEAAATEAAAEAAAEAEAEAARAAELEAERLAAERAAEQANQTEAERTAQEEEAARLAAEQEAARLAEAQRAARLAEEQEAARLAEEQEAARLAQEQEAARLAQEQEAARLAAEAEAARVAAEREAALAQATTLTIGEASHVHRAEGGAANPAIAYVSAPGLRVDLSSHVDDVLHVRVTVVERPGDDPMAFQLCLVPPDVTVAPACSAADLLVLHGTGTYEAIVPWRELAGTGSVDWRNGVEALMWVLRRPDGAPVTGSGSDVDRYLPTTLRVRAVAVPAGAVLPGGR